MEHSCVDVYDNDRVATVPIYDDYELEENDCSTYPSNHLMDIIDGQNFVGLKLDTIAKTPKRKDFFSLFGFRQNPFGDSLNPDFFYKTKQHEQAFMRMLMSVDQDISLGLVTGTSGTGKTLLSQMILRELDPQQFKCILVMVSPGMRKTALLKEILQELNIECSQGPAHTQQLLKLLSDYIMKLHSQNRKLVIMIDECHFLSADSLHTLRTLSNIETPKKKLVTCLLFAEPRFLQRLSHPSYQSLRSRMYMRTELKPLNMSDCIQYVKYRQLIAGGDGELFDTPTLSAIHQYSSGISRQINKLCAIALMENYLKNNRHFEVELIRQCASQL